MVLILDLGMRLGYHVQVGTFEENELRTGVEPLC